jgi:hypothetical protein
VGLLLSTPLTVLLVVMGKYVPQLSFLTVLLGDEPVLEPHRRYYQRLLAMDAEEAEDLIFEFLQERPLEDLYDSVVIPALSLFEGDRHRGDVDEERQTYLLQAVREHIERIGEQRKEAEAEAVKDHAKDVVDQAKGKSPPTAPAMMTGLTPTQIGSRDIHVLCLPAADEADEMVALMLAQVLGVRGFSAEAVAVKALASEMMDLVEKHHSEIVCVSALPPAAITHSRYLCKRLSQRFPKMRMVVGLWNFKGDVKRSKDRIGCSDAVVIATSMCQVLETLRKMTPQIRFDLDNESGLQAVAPKAMEPANP